VFNWSSRVFNWSSRTIVYYPSEEEEEEEEEEEAIEKRLHVSKKSRKRVAATATCGESRPCPL